MEQRTLQPLAKALCELMQERGLSGSELAAKAGVTAATVSFYLSGARGRRMNKPALATVERLAESLGVSSTYFLEVRQVYVKERCDYALAEGLIEPEDIDMLIDVRRALRAEQQQ